jgi:alkyl hydroperoxide reductase subunit AhpC
MENTQGPIIGKPAPEFRATAYHNGEFKEVQLSDFKGKYVVLFFYPLDFTFVCPTEILSFSSAKSEFDKLNTVLLGCSVDSHFVHMKWCKTAKKQGGIGEIEFPLLSDLAKDISKAYRCLIEDGADKGVSLRATFVIDGKGILRHMSYNDLPVGRNIDECLRLVKAFQYVEEYGEVCPAKWRKKGDPTMKTDHNEDTTKKYFEENN